MSCSKENAGETGAPYYLRKQSSFSENVTHTTSTYEYDSNKRLISEYRTSVDAGGNPSSGKIDFTYSADGKIQFRIGENGRKQIEFARDANGRIVLVNFYLDDGATIYYAEQYAYFEDRYERRLIQVVNGNSRQTGHDRNYYTPDKKNIARSEYFDKDNVKTGSIGFSYSEAKNPEKLIQDFFGYFSNEQGLERHAL